MLKKYLLLFIVWNVMSCFSTAFGNETDHDHDHEHDHEHEDEGFHLLVESITGSHGDTLDGHDIHLLIETLEMRFHLENIHACLEDIHALAPPQEEYNATTFLGTAQRTLDFLINGNCSHALETNDLPFDDVPVCQQEVSESLRDLEVYYEGFSTEQCFNEYTLLHENCTEENSDLIYLMLADLYDGKCILPSSHFLEDELFEHIGVEGEVVTEENFATLLTTLQIGAHSEESHNDETDHDHDHEHELRKRREVAEDDHADHDHDHDHDHGESHNEICYSDSQLRSIFGHYGNLTRDQVIIMCPAFLQQIVGGACSASHTEDPVATDANYTTAMKYGFGTAAVVIISLLAFVGMLFFPVLKTTQFRLAMQFFIALGVGTMSGDAIFHILPDIVGLHSHAPGETHDHGFEVPDYQWKLVVVVAAIWALFLFENGLKLFSSNEHHHSHDHSYTPESSEIYENMAMDEHQNQHRRSDQKTSVPSTDFRKTSVISDEISDQSSQTNSDIKRELTNTKKTYFWGITATGIMVFLGDTLHNFGDGIAIGAAFSFSWPQGVGTSLAIIFHELPHEFGDFAIYLNNGLTKCKALMMNFAAACCCFIGLYVALALSEDPGVRVWLLSFVAGMFLYVSFVNVLREMVEERTPHPKIQFALQNLGLVLGWLILFLLAIFEEQLINSIS